MLTAQLVLDAKLVLHAQRVLDAQLVLDAQPLLSAQHLRLHAVRDQLAQQRQRVSIAQRVLYVHGWRAAHVHGKVKC